jgi:hypothetical protein
MISTYNRVAVVDVATEAEAIEMMNASVKKGDTIYARIETQIDEHTWSWDFKNPAHHAVAK